MERRLGITLPIEPFINRRIGETVRLADDCGYTDAWTFEANSSDAFSPIAAMAMLSSKLRFGTAIVPIYTRPPALIAMQAATVQNLSGGRFILGIGISSPAIVQNWMGVPYVKTHTRTRETVAALRTMLKGEKYSVDGKTVKVNGFRMDLMLDAPPPPIYLGAQGSAMCRMAGEIGDGLITNFVTTDSLPAMVEHTREGMRAAGKDPSNLDVVCRINVAVGEDVATARGLFKRNLAAYITVPGYNKFFREIGYENEAGKAMELWTRGERKAALDSLPDEMVEKIYVFGDAKTCRKRVDEFFKAGVTTTALQFVSFTQKPEEKGALILKAIKDFANA
ncbi:MAG TPA: LLM class F420-dependent oxidoreductase, partial [Candidatus Binataceae bacterium]|nr:LLM class F420-dependent oxidoreductase [Candidatus Binataceae bacterium]